jgi:hypothetical protein
MTPEEQIIAFEKLKDLAEIKSSPAYDLLLRILDDTIADALAALEGSLSDEAERRWMAHWRALLNLKRHIEQTVQIANDEVMGAVAQMSPAQQATWKTPVEGNWDKMTIQNQQTPPLPQLGSFLRTQANVG